MPMGLHLHDMFGPAYRSLALLHTADHVPDMLPDPGAEAGFTLAEVDLQPPVPGSVEAALADAGLGATITLTDVRPSPRDAQGAPLLNRIRTQSAELNTVIPSAFDAVLAVPTVTRDRTVRF
ncbi:erythromycin esterase family protein [Nonomuraea sp. NPDC000554]|uniref:erythromycin esterase family protein n=1 Tax=Nonomuraea sp. NPDC000554 TaxID=3154259 RepID=UPI003322F704